MNNENILLTVIIPAYNVEQYISKCIESVITQTYKNIEILVVDDGSTDSTGEICDEFAQRDSRIVVYHKNNGGLVSARKSGISRAHGELVTFVDSDDWVDPDMYSRMIEEYRSEHADMISSGIVYEMDGQREFHMDNFKEGTYSKREIWQYIIPRMMYDIETDTRAIIPSVCIKLFRLSLLKKVFQPLDDKITFGEDGAIVYPFIAYADKITILNHVWYHYLCRDHSIMRNLTIDSFEKVYRLEQYLMNEFGKIDIILNVEFQVKHYIKDFLCQLINKIYKINIKDVIHVFPYGDELNGCRIVLYGAGCVGQSYWKYLKAYKNIILSAWVDKNYEELQRRGLNVTGLNALTEVEYDYIIVAVENEKVANEIRHNLLCLGVSRERILWKKGQVISGENILV